MSWKRGDVVLVDFPFVDRHGSKLRPALVISSARYRAERPQDVIVAVISTQLPKYKGATDYLLQDWQSCGLRQSSVIRSTFLTILASRIQRKVGRLTKHDLSEFEKRMRISLKL